MIRQPGGLERMRVLDMYRTANVSGFSVAYWRMFFVPVMLHAFKSLVEAECGGEEAWIIRVGLRVWMRCWTEEAEDISMVW